MFYSAPSHLINQRLPFRLRANQIELYFNGQVVLSVDRVEPGNPQQTKAVIDFRHWIDNFDQYPNAFDDHEFRDEFFPCQEYQQAYQLALTQMDKVAACRYIIAVLQIANQQNCVAALATAMTESLQDDQLPLLSDLQTQFEPQPKPSSQSVTSIRRHHLTHNRAKATVASMKRHQNLSLLDPTMNSFIQLIIFICATVLNIFGCNEQGRQQLCGSTMQALVHTMPNHDGLQQLLTTMSNPNANKDGEIINHDQQKSELATRLANAMLDFFDHQKLGQILPRLVPE